MYNYYAIPVLVCPPISAIEETEKALPVAKLSLAYPIPNLVDLRPVITRLLASPITDKVTHEETTAVDLLYNKHHYLEYGMLSVTIFKSFINDYDEEQWTPMMIISYGFVNIMKTDDGRHYIVRLKAIQSEASPITPNSPYLINIFPEDFEKAVAWRKEMDLADVPERKTIHQIVTGYTKGHPEVSTAAFHRPMPALSTNIDLCTSFCYALMSQMTADDTGRSFLHRYHNLVQSYSIFYHKMEEGWEFGIASLTITIMHCFKLNGETEPQLFSYIVNEETMPEMIAKATGLIQNARNSKDENFYLLSICRSHKDDPSVGTYLLLNVGVEYGDFGLPRVVRCTNPQFTNGEIMP